MNDPREIHIPANGPGKTPPLSAEIFRAMGESGIFQMLEDFYAELGRSEIRGMFPKDLVAASQRSAAFYVQLLGGPALYDERYGSPMMRKRHLPFVIDEAARQVWLGCFYRVLGDAERYGFPAAHLPVFREWLDTFSKWMVNAQGPAPTPASE